jgi:hypothetical protein
MPRVETGVAGWRSSVIAGNRVVRHRQDKIAASACLDPSAVRRACRRRPIAYTCASFLIASCRVTSAARLLLVESTMTSRLSAVSSESARRYGSQYRSIVAETLCFSLPWINGACRDQKILMRIEKHFSKS